MDVEMTDSRKMTEPGVYWFEGDFWWVTHHSENGYTPWGSHTTQGYFHLADHGDGAIERGFVDFQGFHVYLGKQGNVERYLVGRFIGPLRRFEVPLSEHWKLT